MTGTMQVDPLERRLATDKRLAAAEAAALREALATVLHVRPDVQGASAYPIARGELVVRLMLAGGWLPVIVTNRSTLDGRQLLAALDHAVPAS